MFAAAQKVNQAIDNQDKEALLAALRLPALGILSILEANSQRYLEHFTSYRDHKAKVGMSITHIKVTTLPLANKFFSRLWDKFRI